MDESEINQAVAYLKQGGVIAYPTESVYGLGCNPFNLDAICRILQIKHRSIDKGFILVASNWEQIEPYVEPIEPPLLAQVLSTWPGPITWVFPAKLDVPHWIRGKHTTLAVRISDHPIVQAICQFFGGPIISTSANIEGQPPARDYRTTQYNFGDQVDFIVNGKVGGLSQPTEIREALTGEIIRQG